MMKFTSNKNLILVAIAAASFYYGYPNLRAEEIKLSVPTVEKNQAMKLTPEQIKALIKKNGKIITGPRITNSKAVEKRAAIIATLRTQKQAADAQRATFRAAIKVAPTSPALTPSSAQPVAPPSTALMQSRSGPAGNLQMSRNVPSIGSSRLESETVKPALNIPSAKPALNIPSAAAVQGIVSNARMQCTPDHQGIWDINGMARKKVIFTPDPEYHIYVISGCGFGNSRGAVHLSGPFVSGVVNMAIESWEDTQIVASIDPNISGELDHDNVSLVLVPVGKPPMQDTGHKFYAVRETIFVPKIPLVVRNLWIDLGATYSVTDDHSFPGTSIEVDRWEYHKDFLSHTVRKLDIGDDHYNFSSYVKPGFTVDGMAWTWLTLDPSRCNYLKSGWVNADFEGDNGIKINFGKTLCNQINMFDQGFSVVSYGLSVWLVGPKGVNPWKQDLSAIRWP